MPTHCCVFGCHSRSGTGTLFNVQRNRRKHQLGYFTKYYKGTDDDCVFVRARQAISLADRDHSLQRRDDSQLGDAMRSRASGQPIIPCDISIT
jgi:hypothetical protein